MTKTPRPPGMVPENTAAGQAIGDPVEAEDANGDILTYTLTDDGGGTEGRLGIL